MKEEDIHFMFNDIIQRSEQVFSQGGTESDLTIYHLPSLLESLASIVKEMEQVCCDWLNFHFYFCNISTVIRIIPFIIGEISCDNI